jgi:hypothetical protein
MQAGGWCRDRTVGAGENSLITLLVFNHFARLGAQDVGRQRDFAQPVQFAADVRRTEKSQPPMAFTVHFHDRGANPGDWVVAWKNDLRSDAGAFAGAQHHPPIVGRAFFNQQDFKFATGPCVRAAQPGGNHARLVENEHVARAKKPRQIPELTMFDVSLGAMQDQEPRFIALWRGMLRDQAGWQIEMEISGSHTASFRFQVSSFKPSCIRFLIQSFNPGFWVVNNSGITPKNNQKFLLTKWGKVVKSGSLWRKVRFEVTVVDK